MIFDTSKLFISYRRSDAEHTARSLREALAARFGPERIFFDTSDIPYGEDFQRVVHERIAESDVVLVVIGPAWLSVHNEHGRRLDQDDDPVRFELGSALQLAKRIVPLRVDGAGAPDADALPPPLRALARLNMPELRAASFDIDFDALVRQLLGQPPPDPRLHTRLTGIVKGGPLASALLVIAALAASWTGALDLLNLDTQAQRLLLHAGVTIANSPVLLVTIDAASEHALGRPFSAAHTAAWRADHARLIDRAAAAGASAVVFDMFFESSSDADARLADAAHRARSSPQPLRVIFGVRQLDAAGQPALVAPLRDAAAWGSLCLVNRSNGALWASPLAVLRPATGAGGEQVSADTPSLALQALVDKRLLDADLGRRQLRFDGPPRNPPLRFSTVQRQRVELPGCMLTHAGDEQATLRFRAAPAGFWRTPEHSVSYAQALDPAELPDSRLANRIILVGLTTLAPPGVNPDLHAVRDGWAQRTVYGVELQADAITTLASGRVPQLPTADRQVLTSLLMCVLGGGVAVLAFERPPWQRRGALLAVAVGWLALAWWLARNNIFLEPVTDIAVLCLAALAFRSLQVMARRYQAFRRVRR